jgi:hypothetical protein
MTRLLALLCLVGCDDPCPARQHREDFNCRTTYMPQTVYVGSNDYMTILQPIESCDSRCVRDQ